MKKIYFLVLSASFLFAQETFNTVSFSPFYTIGEYSNNTKSESKAVYGSVNFNQDFIISAGIDLISLRQNEWNYNQNTFYLSTIKNISPFYLKLAGSYLKGKYSEKQSDFFNYTDENLSLTPELVYKFNWNYVGLAYNYFKSSKGFQILKAQSLTLRFDTFLDFFTYLSIRPNLYIENSGKKLFSVSSKLTRWITSDFVVSGTFVAGNRRYYFDNDLLTIYNQYDIQKIVAGVSIDYSLINEVTISGGYQFTKFENFEINYVFLGLRTKLTF